MRTINPQNALTAARYILALDIAAILPNYQHELAYWATHLKKAHLDYLTYQKSIAHPDEERAKTLEQLAEYANTFTTFLAPEAKRELQQWLLTQHT